jgi:cell division protein FtsQ
LGIFRGRAGGGSRRSFRLLLQRVKALGIYALCAALVIGAGVALWRSGSVARVGAQLAQRAETFSAAAGFKIGEIAVTGRHAVPAEDIARALNVSHGAPIFSADLVSARARLLEMPWVRSAAVSRILPDKILVEIEERAPVALWQYNRKVSVVDAEGTVLAGGDLGEWRGLPMVVGAGAGKNAAALLSLVNAEPGIASAVTSAARIGGRRWDLHMKGGAIIMLPEKDPELALARLAAAQREHGLLDRNAARIDLRLPGRIVLEPHPEEKSAGADGGRRNI